MPQRKPGRKRSPQKTAKSTKSSKAPNKATKTKTKPVVRVLSESQVAKAVETMSASSGTARFAAGKALTVTAAKDPARVYPYFDAIAALLASDSKIVRWNAMLILPLLAPVDQDGKLPAILDAYLSFIRGSNLISAANAIGGAGKIAASRPELLDRILPAILEVEGATYETPECRNVAIGQALDALGEVWSNVRGRAEVASFVRRQLTNSRTAVARRAEKMAADLA